MLFLYHLCATQESKVISLGVWEERRSNLWAISESPEASLQRGHGLRHGRRNQRSWFLWTHRELVTAHPRLRWRIFLYRSPARLYPRPSTSKVPCWMTHSWLHLCLKKYWVEIALALAPVPQWSHSSFWPIMMRFCLNYNLRQIFSYFFQKKTGLLSSLYFKFYLQVNITFSPIYFYFMSMMDENRSQCFNCSNKMNHLSCAFYSVQRFFS